MGAVKGWKKRGQAGFTLVELAMAVAVIAIVMALSFPSFIRMRVESNESGVQKALLAYRNAFVMYQMENPTIGYPGDLAELVNHVDAGLAAGARHGYTFTLSNVTVGSYTITAAPANQGITGVNTYILTEGGTVTKQAPPQVSGNLSDDYDRLNNLEISRAYGGFRYTKDGFELDWNFTNVLNRTLSNVIVAIDRMRFGGAALGSKLVSDGLVDKDKSGEKKVNYYYVGDVKAGETVKVTEKVFMDNKPTGGWWYSRSIQPYEQIT